jgi:hypothetical protein
MPLRRGSEVHQQSRQDQKIVVFARRCLPNVVSRKNECDIRAKRIAFDRHDEAASYRKTIGDMRCRSWLTPAERPRGAAFRP